MVEADGEWHTSDNKYGSAGWKAAHAPAVPKQAPLSPRKSPPKASIHSNGASDADPNGKKKPNVEIFVLDSDDSDEEGRVKRELSPSIGSGSSAAINRSMETASLSAASQPQADVIDLTLDSDEDDEPPPPSRTAEKRKAPEHDLPSPTEQAWKKARVDAIPPTVMRNVNGHANGINGTAGSSHVNGTISPSALNALHMQPVHYDPLRDAQRAQSSIYSSRPPSVPRPPATVTSPTLRFGNPPFGYLGPNSPPQPPPPPRPRQPSSGGHLTPRGRDFSSFGGASGSRWP
jgi:E3 SUMO-protein ligase PIAS1